MIAAEERKIHESEFRLQQFSSIMIGGESPSFLINQGFAKRLPVIFDIDHTLIYSIDERLADQKFAKLPSHQRVYLSMRPYFHFNFQQIFF